MTEEEERRVAVVTAALQGKRYERIDVAQVTARLKGTTLEPDKFAEFHPCRGCGAPAGYRCLVEGDTRVKCRFQTALGQGGSDPPPSGSGVVTAGRRRPVALQILDPLMPGEIRAYFLQEENTRMETQTETVAAVTARLLGEADEIRRIVSVQRGSWKYQDAYKVVAYRPAVTKSGKLVWQHSYDVTGKLSMPQLKRLGWYPRLSIGSMHNKPVSQVVA